MAVAKPIIRQIKDNSESLDFFETVSLPSEDEKTQKIIMDFPTVYIHNWKDSGDFEVYVGESNNIFKRTRQHYDTANDRTQWQSKLLEKDASLFIIGHEHFNKSLTLDIENRLMHYMMSADHVRHVHNLRDKFYANGAAPSGVLEHPGTLKDPGRVRESWQSTFGGSSNANKVAVLEEGMKYTPISIAPNEAQFLETRKFQIDEIARIFRVPPHMVGDLDKSSFSNIEQQSLEFVKYTLDPWVSRWEQAMVRALLSAEEKKKYFFKFNVDGLLRGDYQSRMNGYATARQNGWMSANDIRELENMDRIPEELGGDLYLINGNMTKLEDAGLFGGAGSGGNGKEKGASEEVLELEENENGESGNRTGSGGADPVHERSYR